MAPPPEEPGSGSGAEEGQLLPGWSSLVILLSLFVFGYFFGLLGLFIAVPVTALLMTTYTSVQHDKKLDLSTILAFSRPPAPYDAGLTRPVENPPTSAGVTPDWKAEQPDWKAEQTVNEQPAEAVTMQRNTPPMPEAPPEQPFATLPAELGEE